MHRERLFDFRSYFALVYNYSPIIGHSEHLAYKRFVTATISEYVRIMGEEEV